MNHPFSNNQSRITGTTITRAEPCRICREKTGTRIGAVDYWDIKTCQVVLCGRCSHIQLDPMLTEEETAKGCYAYYIEESLRTSSEELIKNRERNFRRGVVFGYQLRKRRISPKSVLELGPGSGYFSAGLQFVYPGVKITVMDINQNVLDFNRQHHHFETLREVPDNFNGAFKNKFDLIIARDIIEHVTDISKVLENVNEYLQPGGLFHFITPNGHEDIWKHYLTAKFEDTPSELLINHVNYFDGKGLKNLLFHHGFLPVKYFTYNLKTTLRGQGWKKGRKLMNPVSKKLKADLFIKGNQGYAENIELSKDDILDKWYIRPKVKWITWVYCLFHHFTILRISPVHNIGHEIFGLFLKDAASRTNHNTSV